MNKVKVFVVDDEISIQRLLNRALESFAYQVQIFPSADGLEASPN